MPDEIVLDILFLMFEQHSFLDPPRGFPSLELDGDFPGADGFHDVEVDVPGDGVACEVERLVELNEGVRHICRNNILQSYNQFFQLIFFRLQGKRLIQCKFHL